MRDYVIGTLLCAGLVATGFTAGYMSGKREAVVFKNYQSLAHCMVTMEMRGASRISSAERCGELMK